MEGSTGADRLWRSGLSRCAAGVLVGLAAALEPARSLDRRLHRTLNRGRGRGADVALEAVTELGSIWASAGAAAAVAAAGGRRRAAADALGAALAMWAVGQGLKRVFARPRPYQGPGPNRLLIDRPRGTSWPSSHPAVLLTFGTVLARDLGLPGRIRRRLTALAGVVGLSRVYLGVHYPSDVAGGLLLGRGLADLWTAAVSSRWALAGNSGHGPR